MHKLCIIILAGGQGSRLKGVLGKTPKVMAKIKGRPFVEYLIEWIQSRLSSIPTNIYFATGIGHETIDKYARDHQKDWILVQEFTQLGTLGAAANCVRQMQNGDQFCLILNGDTLFEADLVKAFHIFLKNQESPLVIVKKEKMNQRYGGYSIKDELLYNDTYKPEYISMGAVFARGVDLIRMDNKASKKNLQRMMDLDFIQEMDCRAYVLSQSTRFIDIGVPKSYYNAQLYIPKEF